MLDLTIVGRSSLESKNHHPRFSIRRAFGAVGRFVAHWQSFCVLFVAHSGNYGRLSRIQTALPLHPQPIPTLMDNLG